jgi:hypothetical protein
MKKFRELAKESRVEDVGFNSNAARTLREKPNKEPMPKLKEEVGTPSIGVRSLYTKMYAKHGGTASKAKDAQSKAYAEVEKKHGKEMRNSLEVFHKKNMNEAVKDKFDIGEYDQEGDMAKSDLRSILANAKRVHDMLEDDDNLPEWVQAKITKAEDYMSTVANYMEAEMNEEVEQLDEKNKPTNPELWSRAVSLAKSKFDVYPSAYANGWAAKWYKERGGGWRSVSEEVVEEGSAYDRINARFKKLSGKSLEDTAKYHKAESEKLAKQIKDQEEKNRKMKNEAVKNDDLPFTPDKPQKKSVVVGKKPEGYSIARQLARQAMQKQMQKMKKPMKEAEERGTEPFLKTSRKAKIVKTAAKKGQKTDNFESEPELSSSITRNQ